MQFRKDVNGLRAIAVAAVVLYHYGVWPAHGGFVGVDIFFVISGFLLTSITYGEIRSGNWSVREFLMRRVRRIFPALVVVTLATVAWAGYAYLPDDYMRLVRDATSVLVMRSNYVFHGATGYFAPDAKQNLFLHTWSLSLESQFYLIFAFLCVVFWPKSGALRQRLGTALFAAIALASLVWCIVHTPADANSTFYLLWSRAWEFMAGSVVAVYTRGRAPRALIAQPLGLLGIGLIGWGIVALSADDPYPGWRALFPVLGTMLIIYARSGVVTRVLGARPVQFLGTISYSVYLWHWPILLAFRERTGHDPAVLQTAAMIVAATLAGWLSYRLVEVPTRKRSSNRQLLAGALGCVALAFAFSGAMKASDGWPQRLPRWQRSVTYATLNTHPQADKCMRDVDGTKRTTQPGDFCTIGAANGTNGGSPSLMLWGDSFANRLQPAVDDIAAKLGVPGIVATQGGCPPFKGQVFKGSGAEVFSGCERFANFVFDHFMRTPTLRYVVIAGDWQCYDPGYEGDVIRQIAATLAERHGKLVLVTSVPSPGGDLPHQWARAQFQAGHAIGDMTVTRAGQARLYGMGQEIASFAARGGEVIVVDPFAAMCAGQVCYTVKDDRALFADTDHLSEAGVAYLAPAIEAALRRAMGQASVAGALGAARNGS
ncbi:peptidoglycan/LPS O-acetylase OafA/YrhL [Paraburkholderia bannensis]|uniref:Peptidoglycan/LPS O-acetylase OafA/YrhL n=1 Tax=Paraburkholderia bannensis TaxID=765414 RepID=A0A7W9TSE0_9BURK|nr:MULTISPECIES: acyltransferase family protein [Paraburkholderia]MBB3255350.1 peptidoglycan/LPS O-acetylase OafA/YrhL [Paraburkholderia sp. WP4_3_2]MBB6100638.1 peptidoglycan/LPS O-acetylase OafA/YrhL [Paraburkholderia bannensis]